jgi:hypothetical protein
MMLVHVEDPGAANWMVPLLPELWRRGHGLRLVVDGAARDYLAARDIHGTADMSLDGIDFLLTGTSENLESRGLAAIAEARGLGIPSAAIVDQAVNAHHRFRGTANDPLGFAPDHVFVPDDAARDAFVALGLAAGRITVCGNPHHDRVVDVARRLRAEGRDAVRCRLFPGIPPGRPLVLFASEVGYVVNPESSAWIAANRFAGRGGTRYRSAVVLEEVLDACGAMQEAPAVVLRLHPKNDAAEFAAYEGELAAISAGGDPLEAVFAADLVIGMTSALLEDAALVGCAVLSVLPRPEEREWLQMLADGRIPAAGSRAELRRLLPQVMGRANSVAVPVPVRAAVAVIADAIEAEVRQ